MSLTLKKHLQNRTDKIMLKYKLLHKFEKAILIHTFKLNFDKFLHKLMKTHFTHIFLPAADKIKRQARLVFPVYLGRNTIHIKHEQIQPQPLTESTGDQCLY